MQSAKHGVISTSQKNVSVDRKEKIHRTRIHRRRILERSSSDSAKLTRDLFTIKKEESQEVQAGK